ncbi:MAG: hypothetical protein WA277_08765 [Nitrospirota bacterium]
MNQIVIRYQNGQIMKGVTNDFLPAKDRFHITPFDSAPNSKPLEIVVADLKAIFFVKDFAGDAVHEEIKQFDPSKPAPGRKIRVVFKDGEVIVGITQGYQPERPGFFVLPADGQSNNERCFVVTSATREVTFL